MKTQIIQLDVHDDVISARDKVNWAQARRILLIWPSQGRVLTRRLDLVLLQRHCTALGAQLGLVTQDSEVRYHAWELGLPVFDTTRQAQSERWRSKWRRRIRLRPPSERRDLASLREALLPHSPGWRDHPALRVGILIISILAIAVLASVLLPGAQITLVPQREIQEMTLEVTAGPTISTVNLAGEIPAMPRPIVVEGRETISTTGSILVPAEAAIGGVRFTNLTEEAVDIPLGTIISTLGADPVQFSTTRAGNMPAGPGKTTTLPVVALLPGAKGNLPSGSLRAVEGELGLSLAVTNPSAMHEGRDVYAPGPAAGDYTRLYERLFTTLRQAAATELKANLEPGEFAIFPSLTFLDTLEEIYSTTPDLPTDQLELRLRLKFQVLVADGDDILALMEPVLDANLAEGLRPLPDTLEILHADQPVMTEEGNAKWHIHARRQVQADIPAGQIAAVAAGLPSTEAARQLAGMLPLQEEPSISTFPAWWPRLPFLPFRIHISLVGE